MEQQLMAQKSQVQVQTESLHLKTGKDRLRVAINSKKIGDSNLDEIKQVLRLTMLKLGIRANNLPSDEEKSVLIAHIIEFYGNHTCEEISLAFNLALSDKLELSVNEVNSYENFSCLYFSKIMNSYRQWSLLPRSEINNEIEKAKRRIELPYDERFNLSDKEIEEWHNEVLDKFIANNEIDFNFLSPELYTLLEQKGYINFNNEQKKVFFDQAIKERGRYVLEIFTQDSSLTTMYYDFLEQKESGKFDYKNINSIKTIAKKIAFLNYLKNKI